MTSGNGWEEYQHLVLAELERHNRWMTDVDSKVTTIMVDIALLKKLLENQEKFNHELIKRQDNFEASMEARIQEIENSLAVGQGEKNVKQWLNNALLSIGSAVVTAVLVYLIIGR